MKKLILYCRRNVGMYCLSFLVSLGYSVKVITDDENIQWLANVLGCEETTMEEMGDDYDLFICVHGNKIIPKKYLSDRMVNIHPCLFKYKGQNPIKRYIFNEDTEGSVESHWIVEEVDAGEVIHQEFFTTPPVSDFASYYNLALPFYFKCVDRTLKIVL